MEILLKIIKLVYTTYRWNTRDDDKSLLKKNETAGHLGVNKLLVDVMFKTPILVNCLGLPSIIPH